MEQFPKARAADRQEVSLSHKLRKFARTILNESRDFVEQEDGQAMAEMAVLLPVYLLFLILAIYVGQHQLVRQQTLEAARYFAWNGTSGSSISTPREFFPRFQNDGNIQMQGANQPNQNLAPKQLPDTEIKKHASGGAATLATEFMNNAGGNGIDFGTRHVVVSFSGLRIPTVSHWLNIELKATRQHSVYVLRDTKKHFRNMYNDTYDRRGIAHPFYQNYGPGEIRTRDSNGVINTSQMSHSSSLPKFDVFSTPWQPLWYWENGGKHPRLKNGDGKGTDSRGAPGDEAGNHYNEAPVLWNRTHKLNGVKPADKTNPFYEHVWRRLYGG